MKRSNVILLTAGTVASLGAFAAVLSSNLKGELSLPAQDDSDDAMKNQVASSMKQWGLEELIGTIQLRKDFPAEKSIVVDNGKTNYSVPEKDSYVVELRIPSNIGLLYEFDRASGSYKLAKLMRVGVGKPNCQTPIGKWRITHKYPLGRKDVEWSETSKRLLTDYSECKAILLNAVIDRSVNYYAHAIVLHNFPNFADGSEFTNNSGIFSPRIGEARSGGCVRLSRADENKLYDMLPIDTRVNIEYNTIFVCNGNMIILDDIYRRKTNNPNRILAKLEENGIKRNQVDLEKLQYAIEDNVGKMPISELLHDRKSSTNDNLLAQN